MNSSTPATIREALARTYGQYCDVDNGGRIQTDGLTFLAADLDSKIGDEIGERITRWDSASEMLEVLFTE